MVDTMITLFESTSTDFSRNGLGNLPDAISCIVLEERNGAFELEMQYPITGKRYGELSLRRIILAKSNPYSNPQPFRIYEITKPINGVVTVYAQHISYDLTGYPVSPFTADSIGQAFSTIKSASVVDHPFTFWTDKTTEAKMSLPTPNSTRAVLGGISGSVLDVYGGEYEFDGLTVKLWNNRGANRGVSIRYGKNLTDLEQEENCSDVYTGVYPFWYSEEDGLVELGEKIISAEGTYDFTRVYPLDLSEVWMEKPTEEQVRTRAQSYMTSNQIGVPKVSLTVSFVQLAQSEEYKDFAILETIHLCDTVNVEFPELKVSATSKCIAIEFNVLTQKYNRIKLGDARSNLASTISDQNKAIEEAPKKTLTRMEQAVDNATRSITGGLGGHVLLHSSTGGRQPDEILIMDTNDINTAKRVWRWNKGGLGYSNRGYNGPYGMAMTQEGEIVANFITAGILDASLLKTGVISSADEKLRIDLNSGELIVDSNQSNDKQLVITDSAISLSAKTSGSSFLYPVLKIGIDDSIFDGTRSAYLQCATGRFQILGFGAIQLIGESSMSLTGMGSLSLSSEKLVKIHSGDNVVIQPGKKKLYTGNIAVGGTFSVANTEYYDLFAIKLGDNSGTRPSVVLAYKYGNTIYGIGGWCGTSTEYKELYFLSATFSGDTWTLVDAGVHDVYMSGGIASGTRLQLKEIIGII